VIGFVLAGGHLVGGILQAIYSDDWDDFIGSDADTIRRSMIASAVFCFVGFILFILLSVFMIFFMIKDWNKKVVKATLKEAVTG
jgi:predicted PurR-regulated permease PerM